MSELRICTSRALCESRDFCAHAKPHTDEHMYENCNSHPCKVRSEMVLCRPIQQVSYLLNENELKLLDSMIKS